MKPQIAAIFLMSFIVGGCATVGGYKQTLNSWSGSNINKLVDSWGYPSRSFQAPNGNMVYVYESKSDPTYTTTSSPFPNAAFGNSIETSASVNWCQTFFEVDSSSSIVKWSFKGNACRQ